MASSQVDNRDRERLEALKKLMAEDPRSLAFVTLAEEHNRLGQHREAADVAQRGLLNHPDSVAGRLALAVAEAEQDRVKEALEQIKRALIIDQENPKALALMGRILLKRGLAKRAVQFLSHAVKLDPKTLEYQSLLADARKRSKDDAKNVSTPTPTFDAQSVDSSENPWNDESDDEAAIAASEHTVFDPAALQKLRNRKPRKKADSLDDALNALGEDAHEAEEPTTYLAGGPENGPKQGGDEPTAFAAKNPLKAVVGKAAKAKMGGSAAEFSRMVREEEAAKAREAAGEISLGADLSLEPKPTEAADAVQLAQLTSSSSKKEVRSAMEAPSVIRERESRKSSSKPSKEAPKPSSEEVPKPTPKEAPAAEEKKPPSKSKKPASGSAPAAASKDSDSKPKDDPPKKLATVKPAKEAKVDSPKPEAKVAKAKEAPASPAPHKQIGHVATRMVDDALWALLGQKERSDDSAPAEPEAPAEAPAKAPVRAKPKKESDAAAEARPGPMVVRTSERFGTWTKFAVVLSLSIAAAFLGHWIALLRAGPGPEVASEEVKGLATELERGGLAALLAAEDQIGVLSRSSPALTSLLDAALAEVYAKRWQHFGHDPEMKKKAFEKLEGIREDRPTVEALSAMVALSTSAADRASIVQQLEETAIEYPESPKTLTVLGQVLEMNGEPMKAVDRFYQALTIHPDHRLTLLELARWHVRKGSYGAAFNFYRRVLERNPTDVEAAIERYVIGQMTGLDPAEAEAVSTLAGLVREEIPEVAKDETGRAALAFAIPLLAKGQLTDGLRELEKAEAAFEQSPVFKGALGEAFLALGEHERAKESFERAIELSAEPRFRLGLARALYVERSGIKLSLAEEGKRIAQAAKSQGAKNRAQAELPFGTLRFVPGRFELIEYLPSTDRFPEAKYTSHVELLNGEALQKALDAESLTALGWAESKNGNCKKARKLFEDANALKPTASAQVGLGRCLFKGRRIAAAVEALREALALKSDLPAARLLLARTLKAQGQTTEAIDVLEPFADGDLLSPDAMMLLGQFLMERGDTEPATDVLTRAAEAMPGSVPVLLTLGEALHRQGRADEAARRFQEVLSIDGRLARPNARVADTPLSAVALTYFGRAEVERNKRRGVALLRASLKIEGAPPEAHFYLGKALVSTRRTRREGRRELDKFIQAGPEGDMKQEAQRLLRRR